MMMMMMMMIPIVVTLIGIVTAVSDVHPYMAAMPTVRVRVRVIKPVDDGNDVDGDVDDTDSSNTSRNSNRCQSCVGKRIGT